MIRFLLMLAAVIAAVVPVAMVSAQDTPASPAAAEATGEKPAAAAGERAEIRMRNGVVLTGVVRTRQYEILHGTRFESASSPDAPGAGIRLYYALGLNGFFFVRQDSVAEIRFLGTLTQEEIDQIGVEMTDARERAEKDRARAVAEMAAKRAAAKDRAAGETEEGEASAEGSTPPGASAPEVPKRLDPEQLAKMRELLKRFPPTQWKPSRLDEIKKRMVVLDTFPSEEERVFIENFGLWNEAYELWAASQKLAAGDGAAPGEGPAEDSAPAKEPAGGKRPPAPEEPADQPSEE